MSLVFPLPPPILLSILRWRRFIRATKSGHIMVRNARWYTDALPNVRGTSDDPTTPIRNTPASKSVEVAKGEEKAE